MFTITMTNVALFHENAALLIGWTGFFTMTALYLFRH